MKSIINLITCTNTWITILLGLIPNSIIVYRYIRKRLRSSEELTNEFRVTKSKPTRSTHRYISFEYDDQY